MKRQALTLLIVGLLIQSVGYLVDKASVFGFVSKLVSPTYRNGSKALAVFDNQGSLKQGEPGFDAAENALLDILRAQNPPEEIKGIRVTKFVAGDPSLGFSVFAATPKRELVATLSNGQELKWDVSLLRNIIEQAREHALTCASMAVFAFGIGLQIVGFIVEWRRDQDKAQQLSTRENKRGNKRDQPL